MYIGVIYLRGFGKAVRQATYEMHRATNRVRKSAKPVARGKIAGEATGTTTGYRRRRYMFVMIPAVIAALDLRDILRLS